VKEAGDDLLQRITAMESDIRAYLLSGDDQYLATYDENKAGINKDIQLLQGAVGQLPMLAGLMPEIEAKLDALIRSYDGITAMDLGVAAEAAAAGGQEPPAPEWAEASEESPQEAAGDAQEEAAAEAAAIARAKVEALAEAQAQLASSSLFMNSFR